MGKVILTGIAQVQNQTWEEVKAHADLFKFIFNLLIIASFRHLFGTEHIFKNVILITFEQQVSQILHCVMPP